MQDCIWTGERPQTDTERDPISNCGAFFRLELAPCLCTWGGGEPALGVVVGQGLSLQLEKVVPSLEACTIVQNLPASATPGALAGLRTKSAGGKGGRFPRVLWKRQRLPASATPGALGEGCSSVPSRRKHSSLKYCGTDKASWDHISPH